MYIAKMANAWVEHVRKYAKDHGKSYMCALTEPGCKASYAGKSSKAKPIKGKVMNESYKAQGEAKKAMAEFKAMKGMAK
jgi:hypothetical protein